MSIMVVTKIRVITLLIIMMTFRHTLVFKNYIVIIKNIVIKKLLLIIMYKRTILLNICITND